jgi:primosomal protein N''
LIEQKFEEMSERFSDQLDNLRKEVKTQQESAVAALSEKLCSVIENFKNLTNLI